MAFGGSNWLDRVSAGLATLLAQQACLSISLSCCSARQDRSQLNCCHVPFKACRGDGDGSSCCPRGAGGIQGLWSLVGTSVLGRAWVLKQLGDLYRPSSPHSSVHPFSCLCQERFCILNLRKETLEFFFFGYVFRTLCNKRGIVLTKLIVKRNQSGREFNLLHFGGHLKYLLTNCPKMCCFRGML